MKKIDYNDIAISNNIVTIYWKDGNITRATCNKDDKFDIKTGILIAASKHIVKVLDLNRLGKTLNYDIKALRTVLSLLIVNISGKEFYEKLMQEVEWLQKDKTDIKKKKARLKFANALLEFLKEIQNE